MYLKPSALGAGFVSPAARARQGGAGSGSRPAIGSRQGQRPQEFPGRSCPPGMMRTGGGSRRRAPRFIGDTTSDPYSLCVPQPAAPAAPAAPPVTVSPTITVSPQTQTQVSPQISPSFFQAQDSPGATQAATPVQSSGGQQASSGGADAVRLLIEEMQRERAEAERRRREEQAARDAEFQRQQEREAQRRQEERVRREREEAERRRREQAARAEEAARIEEENRRRAEEAERLQREYREALERRRAAASAPAESSLVFEAQPFVPRGGGGARIETPPAKAGPVKNEVTRRLNYPLIIGIVVAGGAILFLTTNQGKRK